MERKEIRKYWFTVEGENENWYLNWLERKINENINSKYHVFIISNVQQNPLKFSKTVNPLSVQEVTHWCDYESNEYFHVKKFQNIIDQLKKSSGLGGREFKYRLGYSNFSFELWIVLHKSSYYESLTNRFEYLEPINNAYNENFTKLEHYKTERNFKRILNSLTLDDVISAIDRAKEIMADNNENKRNLRIYNGYKYYINNPSLSVWESVEKILKECKIIN